MLILTRKFGESIKISDEITVTIFKSKNAEGCAVGITAPRHIPVLREEARKRERSA